MASGYTDLMAKKSGYRKSLGAWGETFASNFLQAKGYQLLERNYHSRYGEVDLIMIKDGTLTAVEVKTRNSTAYGIAEFSINRKKFLSIQKTMQVFFKSHPEFSTDWQLDILVIEKNKDEEPTILHYENVNLEYLND